MDGEVIHALLGLFDQGVAEDFPGQFLGASVDLLQRLINRHRANRHRAVAQNPLARRVDVLAGTEIHHGVRAPLGRPAHLLNFFLNGGSHRRVADVGVDLHQEIAPDDHRFRFRVVDVGRDDGAAQRHFLPHELGRDGLRDRRAEAVARVLLVHHVARTGSVFHGFVSRLPTQILADGYEFHLGRDDPLPSVPELRHGVPGARA